MASKIQVPQSNIPGADIKVIKIIIDTQLTGTTIRVESPVGMDTLSTIAFMEIAKIQMIAQGSRKPKSE